MTEAVITGSSISRQTRPPVFYAAHDPPVVLLQSPDLGHFLTEVVAKTDRSRTSLIDEVRDDRPFRVWRTNPGAVDRATALEQG